MVETEAEPVFAAELANEVEPVEQDVAEETAFELEVELEVEDMTEPEDEVGSEEVGVFAMKPENVAALPAEVAAWDCLAPVELEPEQEPERMREVEAEELEVVPGTGLGVELAVVAATLVEFESVTECIPVAGQQFAVLGPATAAGIV